VRFFLSEAVPYILLGVAFVNLLYIGGIMSILTETLGPAMSSLFGLPREAVVALFVGFLRKDFAVGMLAPIPMTPMQLTVASILLVTYMPCLATLTVLYRELGFRDFIRSMGVMLFATVLVGLAMKTILL
jgi:ferrous iron transport protein B